MIFVEQLEIKQVEIKKMSKNHCKSNMFNSESMSKNNLHLY